MSGAGKRARITGDASLLRRPMMRIVDPLTGHGASIETTDGRLPVTLGGGGLSPIHYTVPVPSAQVKTSLMLAALFIDGLSVIVETRPTRDHTERMMRHMGSFLEIGSTERGSTLQITGRRELQPLHMTIPGDISSAVFFIAAALLTRGSAITIRNVLLNPTRAHILDVLRRMGARIETEITQRFPEPVGDVHVQHSNLGGIEVGGDEIALIIDEIPALAACALFARGRTVVRDAGELRFKESDRIESIVGMVEAFGGYVEQRQDGFTIQGEAHTRAAEVESCGDHRIAMAASVIACATEGVSSIRNAECVGISFPDFYRLLEGFSR
jgi:3-phosphoshikimate 1-carboxyvinyltransferase